MDIFHDFVGLADLVNILVVTGLVVLFPASDYLFQLLGILTLQIRGQEWVQRLEQRHYYESDEPWLSCSHVRCLPVAQHTYRQVVLFLYISLLEELFEEQVGPFLNQVERSERLRDVTRVDH